MKSRIVKLILKIAVPLKSVLQDKIAVIAGIGLLCLISSCHVVRYFWWNFADINDGRKFPKLEIQSDGEPFHFTNADRSFSFKVPNGIKTQKSYRDFDAFLEKNKTVAFLVIRNDTIFYENYFGKYTDSTLLPSFSVSKVFVSALTGIALDEGYIYSTSQSITFFLKELGPEFDGISIENLLNMRSGIKFNEGYASPFTDMAKYYYGTNLLKYIRHLKIKEKPGQQYDYVSVNALLLGQIVERATQTKLNEYLSRKIWIPLGMESDASWNIDSKKHETIKAYCCINAIARDFARFGRLYLHNGNWDGQQVLPAVWVQRSTSVINDSHDSQGYHYTYFWRVLDNGAFFAKGILGQYIFVYPEKNLIFVRLGKNYAGIDWIKVFLDLAGQLDPN